MGLWTICSSVRFSGGAVTAIARALFGGVGFITSHSIALLPTKLTRPFSSRLAFLACLVLLPGCLAVTTGSPTGVSSSRHISLPLPVEVTGSPTEVCARQVYMLQQELIQQQQRVLVAEARAKAAEEQAQAADKRAQAAEKQAQDAEVQVKACPSWSNRRWLSVASTSCKCLLSPSLDISRPVAIRLMHSLPLSTCSLDFAPVL